MTFHHRPNLAWGITGAGDKLVETFSVLEAWKSGQDITITSVLSKAACFVVKTYGLWHRLEALSDKILKEKNANSPFIAGALQTGEYNGLLVAPATGNTVAKIVHGICDSLITNAVAMTNKTRIPVFILPVEQQLGEIETMLPDGKPLTLFTREVDVENTKRLNKMSGIRVIKAPSQIPDTLRAIACGFS